MTEQYDTKFLTNLPYFDFNEAIEEYAFNLEDLLSDNFEQFISNYLTKYKLLRINYIKKNFAEIRSNSHAFKSPLL